MPDDKSRPIIVIKKKAGHGGHHGGAWKVAYADFVTALMSLFIVLWLMNSSAKVQEAVSGYFKDPAGTGKFKGTDKEGKGGKDSKTGAIVVLTKEDMPRLKEALENTLKALPDFPKIKDQVVVSVTGEGLRIEMMETEKGMFFESGSPKPTTSGTDLLRSLAAQLGTLPNGVLIEGHTDARPYSGDGTYSNWELSADRANQARQIMQANGLHPAQVMQVRGFADQQLRKADQPNDPSNRRISVLVPYMSAPLKADGAEKKGEEPKPAGGEKKAEEQKKPVQAGTAAPHGEKKAGAD